MKGFLFICVLVFTVRTVENGVHGKAKQDVDVRQLTITSEAALRYATVIVKSVMINNKLTDHEVAFHVRLPKEAFITRFVIETENRTIEAVIKEKKKAQETYDKAKEQNITAGLVSQQGITDDLDLDIFEIAINVAANAEVEFRLEYEEFLQRHAGKYSQKLFIDSEHVIPKLEVKCTFKEKQKFEYVSYKTPHHKQRVIYEEGEMSNDGYYVNMIDWKPSEVDQEEATVGLEAPFEVEYELALEDNGGMVFINNEGNFVHMFSGPCVERDIMGKQIVFVIDVSGSMSGNPIFQVREAMMSILSQLRSNDYFSIIIFSGISRQWKTTFQQANKDNIKMAQMYVQNNVKASGSTNINDALLQALDLFGKSVSNERFGQIIVFLTDGEPTEGVTDTYAIRKNVRDRNYILEECCKSAIFTIAFGRNADIEFLRMIAYENAGTLTIIKMIESNVADAELVSLYQDIENPFYKHLDFAYEVGGKMLPKTNITQAQFLLYDCKREIVVTGWTNPGEKVYPSVKVIGFQGDLEFNSIPTVLVLDEESKMLTRLTVYQRIKQLFKEAEVALNDTERGAINNIALGLALEYGFVTPLTSLVVTDSPAQTDALMSHDFEAGMYPMRKKVLRADAVSTSSGENIQAVSTSSGENIHDWQFGKRLGLLGLFLIAKCFITIF